MAPASARRLLSLGLLALVSTTGWAEDSPEKQVKVRESAKFAAQCDPVKDLEIEGLHCERDTTYGASCLAQVVNKGPGAYKAVEYRLGGLP